MDKRYQVFVSSTYTDLIEERRHVTQALLEMDCIPAGMEMFPAVDEEQFEFIQTVIDECDYYILIIAGRYGTLAPDGISYTEKEFDYAISKGIPVIRLLHRKPEIIEAGKTELTDEGKRKLADFRQKANQGRLSREWSTPDELAGLVSRALHVSFTRHPAVGWIRGNTAASQDLLNEVNELRKENIALQKQISELQLQTQPQLPEDIASFDDLFEVRGTNMFNTTWDPARGTYRQRRDSDNFKISWRRIFALISPYLLDNPNDARAKAYFTKALDRGKGEFYELNDQTYQTIKLQLEAYGLIRLQYDRSIDGGAALFLNLTAYGRQVMMDSRIQKALPS